MARVEQMHRLRVAIVDDDVWARERLSDALAREGDIEVVGAYDSVGALLEGQAKCKSVVVVLDVQLRSDPLVAENVASIIRTGSRVLLVSAYFDESSVRGALSAGAGGFHPKSTEFGALAASIRAVAEGRFVVSQEAALALLNDRTRTSPVFTKGETLFLALYASGLSLRSVAHKMNIGYETAKTYSKTIRQKYRASGRQVDSQLDLYNAAVEDGILTRRVDLGRPDSREGERE